MINNNTPASSLSEAITKSLCLSSSVPAYALRMLLIAEVRDWIASKCLALTTSGKLSHDQLEAVVEFAESLIGEEVK